MAPRRKPKARANFASTRPTLVRLLRIHHAIASEAWPSLEALADKCEVHPRTLKRDLRLLRDEFGAPIEYSRERQGYHYTREFTLVPAPFHERELLALSIAVEVANTLSNTPFPDAVRNALEKLQAMMPHVGVEQRWTRLSEALRLWGLRWRSDRLGSGGPEIPHMPSWVPVRAPPVVQLTSAVLETSQPGFTGA